ncbi:DUF4153 domain-containing protein [Alkalibacterium gilvum]|uniref:DUF4153 domain-containing protein n=1 Tax=Alkalibacterium gilvum TaxID=1130080 RepID=UPI003F8E0D6D
MAIKKWFMDRKTQWFASFSRFPLAILALVMIVSYTLMMVNLEGNLDYTPQLISAGLGAMILVSIQLFSEIKKVKKRTMWGAKLFSLSLPILYYFYLQQAPMDFNQAGQIRTIVSYFILSVLLILLPSLVNRLSFSDALIIFIKAFFSSILVSFILYVGISAIFGAFTTLIYDLDYRWFTSSAAIVFQFIAPVYFLSQLPLLDDQQHGTSLDTAKSMPSLLNILIAYVITPVLLVFSLILIVYILINLSGDFWQDNLLEPMLISYTIIGIITVFLSENINKSISRLFSRFFPYLLLVIAIFQTLSSGLKTADQGLTHNRYFVLMFGVFSIVSMLIYIFISSKKVVIPFLLIGLSILSILPIVGAVPASIKYQTVKLDALVEPYIEDTGKVSSLKDVLTTKEKTRFSYSMDYLNQQETLDQLEWLPKHFDYSSDFEEAFGFSSDYYLYHSENQNISHLPESTYAYIELDSSKPLVLSTDSVDEVVTFSTHQIIDKTIALNRESLKVKISNVGEDFFVKLIEGEETALEVDLSELLNIPSETNQTDPTRSLEEMKWTEETDNFRLTVIVKSFERQEKTFRNGEFILLIDYK